MYHTSPHGAGHPGIGSFSFLSFFERNVPNLGWGRNAVTDVTDVLLRRGYALCAGTREQEALSAASCSERAQ